MIGVLSYVAPNYSEYCEDLMCNTVLTFNVYITTLPASYLST